MDALFFNIKSSDDFAALIKGIKGQYEEMRAALQNLKGYWVDLLAFCTMPLPYGLDLEKSEVWALTSREWLSRYRVWRRTCEPQISNKMATPTGLPENQLQGPTEGRSSSRITTTLDAAVSPAATPHEKPPSRRG